jgi:hypothetical protein
MIPVTVISWVFCFSHHHNHTPFCLVLAFLTMAEADDDESMRMEVDPTLADEEQLDENISILKERPDSPRPREFVTSCRGRGRGRVAPAAAPPARRVRTCQVANCSNPTACPGRSNRGNCQSSPEADRTQRKRPKSSVPN